MMKRAGLRVLLVEDDKLDQRSFIRLVETLDLPYDYTISESVSETRRILHSEKFDVLILDYLLGDGTAFEIFDAAGDTPIIFVTGGAMKKSP